jgi:cytidylate kinase
MTLVTVSALYGAGGSQIAPALATLLGVPFLGRPELATEPEAFGEGGGNLLSRVASLALSWGTPPGLTSEDLLPDEVARREFEREVHALAQTGRGVVLGRAAAVILRDDPRALHVLLNGPEEARARQAMVIENVDLETARRRLARTDRLRKAYAEGFYGIDVNAPGTFQLVLDSTAIALDDCVEIIADVARRYARKAI